MMLLLRKCVVYDLLLTLIWLIFIFIVMGVKVRRAIKVDDDTLTLVVTDDEQEIIR